VSPLAFIFARVSWRYLMETLIFALYIAAGALFFGFKVSAGANLGLVHCIILLSIAACSGVGLISASMYWLAGAYRGVEPVVWLVRLLAPLAAGIYVPREVLRAPARVGPRFSAPSGPPVTAPAGPRGCNPSPSGARHRAPRLSPQPHPRVRRVRPARARAAGRRLRRDPANSPASTELGGPGLRPLHSVRSCRVLRAVHAPNAKRGL
jgi:hypothetical protein